MFTVLYTDDEPGLLELGKIYLEQSGSFAVETAISAPDAFTLLQNRPVDCIVSDYQMPETDGIAFLKEVRKRYGDIPFILFTGRGREEVVIEAINNGADSYLQKGGDPAAQFAELSHKIRLAVERRKTIRALGESEEKYHSLVDLAPLAVLVIREGRVVFANPEGVRLAGANTAEDLLNREILPFIHPDDRPVLEDRFPMLTNRVTMPLTEIRIFRIDGKLLTVEAAGKPVLYGGFPSIIVVARDITDRKLREEELRAAYEQLAGSGEELRSQYREIALAQQRLWESQQQLAGITGTVPGVVYQIHMLPDGSFRALYVSSQAGEVFGISNDPDGFTERFIARVDPRDRDAFLESIRGTVATESSWHFEGRFLRPAGDRIWFEGISRPMKKGAMLVFNGVLLDITARKLAEEELRGSEMKFRHILENMQDAYFRTDEQGIITMVNPSAARMFGYTSAEAMTGVPASSLYLSDGDRDQLLRELQAAGGITNFTGKTVRKDGSTFPVSMNVQIIRDNEGQARGTEAIVRDISEKK